MAEAASSAAPGVPRTARPEPREFQRAYKACIACRKRKSRCELSAEDYSAGRPCARCRRELKDCIFTAARRAPRERRNSFAHTNRDETSSNGGRHSADFQQSPRPPEELDSVSPSRQPQSIALGGNIQSDASPLGQQAASNLPQINGLAAPVMRTVVSSGNDALNVLFEAAHQQSDVREHQGGRSDASRTSRAPTLDNAQGTPRSMLSVNALSASSSSVSRIANAASAALEVWSVCRFVKMGWFTPEEAVLLVELFFQNLSVFSPVLTDFYHDRTNHYHLVTQEPMLCCTILTISSRYNRLPGVGAVSRGYLIHERLWEHCQHMISRVMLGQEKGSKAKTRTPGTVEALLLLTEWNPRRMHFPPPNDGWDSDLLMSSINERDELEPNTEKPYRGRWLEDVINPARRSGRMSWMLVGCALSLAHELGILDDTERDRDGTGGKQRPREKTSAEQHFRIRRLLYLYMEQLSLRLGFKSIVPQILSHAVLASSGSTTSLSTGSKDRHLFMGAWIELTRTVKSVSDMLFPSPTFTSENLRNGRYVSLIEHFQPLLSSWREKHLKDTNLGSHFYEHLCIEYQSARIFTNSLGLQAVVERTLAESNGTSASNSSPQNIIDATDYSFIQEVVDGSLEILRIAIRLAETGVLMYAPVGIYLRITTASIYLLKGISICVGATKLRTSLDVLTRCIAGLRASAPDDMHLGSSYATLLEMHVDQLQKRFIPIGGPHSFAATPPSMERTVQSAGDNYETSFQLNSLSAVADTNCGNMAGDDASGLGEEWLTLPLDASLVPFLNGGPQAFPWLGDGTLDFIWNLES
ncbi:hypothetical protein K469DRAFT_619721 [Zopfia rhizophila CBS 207.26]|uniref:Zn(2)-C6 fungal-type domain-containing protein n=1 Tax=Zopfia rhizophila CBS 207.26 TaxID=1314779 RepID=A0A6A6ELS7_9PEZI|nr:hypothetical protein K469DRAFT_619721 [Zopfia rhizophila CBS 207.26]